MGVCNCSMFCCTLLNVHSSIAIILMGKRELIALLNLSSWCLVMVERLFLTVPQGCLQFVIVVFPDHTHYFKNVDDIERELEPTQTVDLTALGHPKICIDLQWEIFYDHSFLNGSFSVLQVTRTPIKA